MDNRLDGLNPLAYLGVKPYSPPQMVFYYNLDPNSTDFQNFTIGCIWVNTPRPLVISNIKIWMLVALAQHVATWVLLTTGNGTVLSLTGNSGGPVLPTVGNINVVGDGTTVNIVGNPGTSTLTVSTTGAVAISYVEDSGTAVPALGILNVKGSPGSRTFKNINTNGSGNTIVIDTGNQLIAGDLSALAGGAAAFRAQTGNFTALAGNVNLPATTADTFQGQLTLGGSMFLSAYGTSNTFLGAHSGNTSLTIANATGNTGIGTNALDALVGSGVLLGFNNVALGSSSLSACTDGKQNTGCGTQTLQLVTTGGLNSALGNGCLSFITTGNRNIGIGYQSGINYILSESDNILINNNGVLGESNIIRIGNSGSGSFQQNKCFIAGIRGVTTDAADAIAVLISSTGQLGTVSSSIKFKENIIDMNDSSSKLMELRPIMFNWKQGINKRPQPGLIAEEVIKIMPELVVHDHNNEPFSVKYHDLPVMLLNEIQKLRKELDELKSKLN